MTPDPLARLRELAEKATPGPWGSSRHRPARGGAVVNGSNLSAVKERPILFSAPMVRALLDGTKTQTRRVRGLELVNANPKTWALDILARLSALFRSLRGDDKGKPLVQRCPYGAVGDRLWVRETWAKPGEVGDHTEYRADNHDPSGARWRPSIHMPRWACRLVLEITDVRVERLQEISEDDARSEGVSPALPVADQRYVPAYARLWDEINGAGAWDANPYVWAISFKRANP